MHPLTKLLADNHNCDDGSIDNFDKLITDYLKSRAEWLKEHSPIKWECVVGDSSQDLILKAFQLEEKEGDFKKELDFVMEDSTEYLKSLADDTTSTSKKFQPNPPSEKCELPKKITGYKILGQQYGLDTVCAERINELIEYLDKKEGSV